MDDRLLLDGGRGLLRRDGLNPRRVMARAEEVEGAVSRTLDALARADARPGAITFQAAPKGHGLQPSEQ